MERLALFDFDNVIYKGHSVFDIIKAQENDGYIERGVWKNIEGELIRYKNKEASYKEAADKMLAYWARGLESKTYESAVDYVMRYFDAQKDKLNGWFEQSVPQIKPSHDILIVTTNYQFIAEAVVKRYGLNGYLSSVAEVKNGVFTGMVEKSLAGNNGEVLEILRQYPNETTIAVGDSENDIDMLELVGVPICFQPDEKLLSVAKKNNWLIADNDTMLTLLSSAIKL